MDFFALVLNTINDPITTATNIYGLKNIVQGGATVTTTGNTISSDIRLKHDITLLGRLDNGLGFYRFIYNGGDEAYVGVMAQEVQAVMPDAVIHGQDGYLRVFYEKIGLKFETYDQWVASGAKIPTPARITVTGTGRSTH